MSCTRYIYAHYGTRMPCMSALGRIKAIHTLRVGVVTSISGIIRHVICQTAFSELHYAAVAARLRCALIGM